MKVIATVDLGDTYGLGEESIEEMIVSYIREEIIRQVKKSIRTDTTIEAAIKRQKERVMAAATKIVEGGK